MYVKQRVSSFSVIGKEVLQVPPAIIMVNFGGGGRCVTGRLIPLLIWVYV